MLTYCKGYKGSHESSTPLQRLLKCKGKSKESKIKNTPCDLTSCLSLPLPHVLLLYNSPYRGSVSPVKYNRRLDRPRSLFQWWECLCVARKLIQETSSKHESDGFGYELCASQEESSISNSTLPQVHETSVLEALAVFDNVRAHQSSRDQECRARTCGQLRAPLRTLRQQLFFPENRKIKITILRKMWVY